jgi:hypothetical protein
MLPHVPEDSRFRIRFCVSSRPIGRSGSMDRVAYVVLEARSLAFVVLNLPV